MLTSSAILFMFSASCKDSDTFWIVLKIFEALAVLPALTKACNSDLKVAGL